MAAGTDALTGAGATRRDAPLALLPLLIALAITVAATVYPHALSRADGTADHWAAMAAFWAMSAGYVRGVGFIPQAFALRLLLSGWASAAGAGLAALRVLGVSA